MIPVAVQFDSPSPTSDQVLKRRIVETFATYNYCVTLAEIPLRRMNGHLVSSTKEHAVHLLGAISRGTVDIASHGFSHGRHPMGPHGQPSDFTGLVSPALLEVIRRGLLCLTQLFGDKIYGFVPRWNSLDRGTLDALDSARIRYLSGAWKAPLALRADVGLLHLTFTCLPSRLRSAKPARPGHCH